MSSSENRRILRALLGALLWAAVALFPASAALADALDARMAAGEVGEQLDGYVGIVIDNPSGELRALVGDINRRRREKYRGIAAKRQVEVAQVAALAGQKLVERTPSGRFVRDTGGNWRRRR